MLFLSLFLSGCADFGGGGYYEQQGYYPQREVAVDAYGHPIASRQYYPQQQYYPPQVGYAPVYQAPPAYYPSPILYLQQQNMYRGGFMPVVPYGGIGLSFQFGGGHHGGGYGGFHGGGHGGGWRH